MGRDREIWPLPRLAIEITHRGGDALLTRVGMRDREIAVAKLAVLVGQIRHAGEIAGLGDGGGVSGPVLPGNAAHRDAAILAVIGPVEIEIALDLLEIR